MDQPVNKVRALSAEVLELQKKLNRSKNSGQQGGVEVKIDGRGNIEVSIDQSYKLSDKARQQLSEDLQAAGQQALDKHKKRIGRECGQLLSND